MAASTVISMGSCNRLCFRFSLKPSFLLGMTQRYLSYMQITYSSLLPNHLWMKYKSQVIHRYASLQTITHPNQKSFSHLPSEDTAIFQSLFLLISLSFSCNWSEFKENTIPVLLLPEKCFCWFCWNFHKNIHFCAGKKHSEFPLTVATWWQKAICKASQ